MGDAYRKSAAFGYAKYPKETLEFFWTGHNNTDCVMYYLNLEKFLNQPDADMKNMLIEGSESPPESLEI